MREVPYNRQKTVAYASQWAMARNSQYLDFSNLGGDCTNFCSQCIYAGAGVMNYTPNTGWYYINGNKKAPAWSAVKYLNRFLLNNTQEGPYAVQTSRNLLQPGDLIQLGNSFGQLYHSLVVLDITEDDIYIAAHTIDSYMRPLSSYQYAFLQYIHIQGVKSFT